MYEETSVKKLFSEKDINLAIDSIADAIIKDFPLEQLNSSALLGIQLRGVPFAKRLVNVIKEKTGYALRLGTLDITMYRDDIGIRRILPIIHETNIPFDLNDQVLIIVDDVLQSGRTVRAALDAITDYGRPEQIKLAVLIDRGLREFPIQADYVGIKVDITKKKRVLVNWMELDDEDAVFESTKPRVGE